MRIQTPPLKRQILSIVLLLAFAAPATVSYFYLRSRQRDVRREVKRMMLTGMEESELVRLSFSKEEAENLEWEHASEFEWNHQMYDVVRSSTQNDSVYYVCYEDDAESELKRKLATLLIDIHKNDPSQKDQLLLTRDFYSSLFSEDISIQVGRPPHGQIAHNTVYKMPRSLVYLGIDCPPPLFYSTCQS